MVQWEVRFIEKFILKINIGKSILVSRQNMDEGNKSEIVKLYLGNGNYQSVYREVLILSQGRWMKYGKKRESSKQNDNKMKKMELES